MGDRRGAIDASAASARLATLDAVRGVAVMGILLLNIIDFAMPSYAYVDPGFYGGATGVNRAAWAIVYVLFDAKMRGLFTMMFGASMVLIAQAATAKGRSPARVHYARMAALFAIGMAHAYLIWSGDILVLYALCGALVFAAWRAPTRLLLTMGIVLLALRLASGMLDYTDTRRFQAAAAAPGASSEVKVQWRRFGARMAPPPQSAAAEVATHRDGLVRVLPARVRYTWLTQGPNIVEALPDTTALMLIGMALFRSGFFSGTWPRRRYWQMALLGYAICVPLYAPLVLRLEATRFSPITREATEAIQLTLLRPWLALAHASVVILFVRSRRWPALAARLGAVGRAAFSNYLGTSIICTLIFEGYGLGWFGHLQRWQCYIVVVGVWGLMLLWSKPWLDRFRYGPFEWLWRSLARWEPQPMRGPAV